MWIQDPSTGELLEASVYYRRKAARIAEVCVGHPVMCTDWAEPVHAPVGDGYVLTSRADMREMCARECVEPLGDHKPPPRASIPMDDPGKEIHDLVYGHKPLISEGEKRQMIEEAESVI